MILVFYKIFMGNEKKQQIIVIGGGEAWDTYDAYIQYLRDKEYNPYEEHGDGWKQLLQKKLGDAYDVIYVVMPSRANAKYNEWVIWFEKLFPYMRDNIILIGHSLGANFLAKYLAENDIPVSIAQLHLVAGSFGVGGGFNLPPSLENVEQKSKKIYIYHSEDDEIVDFADGQRYAKLLPKAKFVQLKDRGHFLVDEFPEIIANIVQ